jgi:hypothetical protein
VRIKVGLSAVILATSDRRHESTRRRSCYSVRHKCSVAELSRQAAQESPEVRANGSKESIHGFVQRVFSCCVH